MRLYDEKEIGEILRRTAELSKSVSRDNADGLSLDELQKLASEAGLDPELVVQAATELSRGASEEVTFDLSGGPLTYSSYHNLNTEIDDESWEQMLPSIREHFNDPGVVQSRASVYEWTGSSSSLEAASTHVSLQKKPGANQLHIIWSENATAIPFFIPTIIGFILSGVFIFEEFALGLAGIPVWIGITGILFLLCRLGVVTYKKSKVKKIKALEKRLQQFASQANASVKRKALSSERVAPLIQPKVEESVPVGRTAANQTESGPGLEIPDDEFDSTSGKSSSVKERE